MFACRSKPLPTCWMGSCMNIKTEPFKSNFWAHKDSPPGSFNRVDSGLHSICTSEAVTLSEWNGIVLANYRDVARAVL